MSKHQDGGMYKTPAYPGYPFLMLPDPYLPNSSVSPSVSAPLFWFSLLAVTDWSLFAPWLVSRVGPHLPPGCVSTLDSSASLCASATILFFGIKSKRWTHGFVPWKEFYVMNVIELYSLLVLRNGSYGAWWLLYFCLKQIDLQWPEFTSNKLRCYGNDRQ